MAESPPSPEPRRGPGIAVLGGDQRGDRDQVVGIGRVTEAEDEGDAQRDEQRSAVEEAGQPGVDLLQRTKEELEIDRGHQVRPGLSRSWGSNARANPCLAISSGSSANAARARGAYSG